MEELVKKVSLIQKELKAPKNQHNSFGNYNYRSCEDILEAVKPLLNKEGLILTVSDDICQIGERYYVKSTATITDGKSVLSNSAYAREEETKKGMDASQITGATSSYARKYALNGLFCIDDTKDSDYDDKPSIPVYIQNRISEAQTVDELKKIYETENGKYIGEERSEFLTLINTKKKELEGSNDNP